MAWSVFYTAMFVMERTTAGMDLTNRGAQTPAIMVVLVSNLESLITSWKYNAVIIVYQHIKSVF